MEMFSKQIAILVFEHGEFALGSKLAFTKLEEMARLRL